MTSTFPFLYVGDCSMEVVDNNLSKLVGILVTLNKQVQVDTKQVNKLDNLVTMRDLASQATFTYYLKKKNLCMLALKVYKFHFTFQFQSGVLSVMIGFDHFILEQLIFMTVQH